MKFFILLSSIFIFFDGYSQSQKDLIVLGRFKESEIMLRWAPKDESIWELGKKEGYIVERFELNTSGEISTSSKKVLAENLRPYTSEKLLEKANEVLEFEALNQLLYQQEAIKSTENFSPSNLMRLKSQAQNQFGLTMLLCDMNIEVAKATGLFFVDTSITPGKRYVYKISSNQSLISPSVIVVEASNSLELSAVEDIEIDFGSLTAHLSWPTLFHKGIYSAYNIERSTNGIDFSKVNDLPYVQVSNSSDSKTHFIDSLEENGKQYYYRVIGLTPFGEKGKPSEIVRGMGKEDLSGTLIISEINKTTEEKIEVKWKFPENRERNITGFRLAKNQDGKNQFVEIGTKLIGKEERSISVDIEQTTYYKLYAIGEDGLEIAQSLPYLFHLEDNSPPKQPENLSGSIDKKGNMRINWNSNNESDLRGYRVFASNSLKDEFIETTTSIISDTVFSQKVNTEVLNREVFYRVVAVDNNFNVSEYSKPVQLLRPDLIAPRPPLFTNSRFIKDKGVVLEWINSSSDDVEEHILERVNVEDSVTRLLTSWSKEESIKNFIDETTEMGKTYVYRITASDKSFNSSSDQTHSILTETGYRSPVQDFTALINRIDHTITLKWNYPKEFEGARIYKKQNNEPFSLYEVIDDSDASFIDRNVVINNTYQYRIQLLLPKKIKTKISNSLKVPY